MICNFKMSKHTQLTTYENISSGAVSAILFPYNYVKTVKHARKLKFSVIWSSKFTLMRIWWTHWMLGLKKIIKKIKAVAWAVNVFKNVPKFEFIHKTHSSYTQWGLDLESLITSRENMTQTYQTHHLSLEIRTFNLHFIPICEVLSLFPVHKRFQVSSKMYKNGLKLGRNNIFRLSKPQRLTKEMCLKAMREISLELFLFFLIFVTLWNTFGHQTEWRVSCHRGQSKLMVTYSSWCAGQSKRSVQFCMQRVL